MLILLIRSHCKICPLATMTILRVCTVGNRQNLQWDLLNEQNQHFAELRQKVCLYIHAVVLLRGLPSLVGKNELFMGNKRKKRLAQPSQTAYKYLSQQLLGVIRTLSMTALVCDILISNISNEKGKSYSKDNTYFIYINPHGSKGCT